MTLEELLLEADGASILESVTFPDGTRLSPRDFETLVAILAEIRREVWDRVPVSEQWLVDARARPQEAPDGQAGAELAPLPQQSSQANGIAAPNEFSIWVDVSRLGDVDGVDLMNLPIQQFIRGTEIERLEFAKFLSSSLSELLGAEIVTTRDDTTANNAAIDPRGDSGAASISGPELTSVPVPPSVAMADPPVQTSRATNIGLFEPFGGSSTTKEALDEPDTSEATSNSAASSLAYAVQPATGNPVHAATVASASTPNFDVGPVADSNGAADTISEAAGNGSAVNITASASDPDPSDSISYSLTDSAGGRFAIDSSSGVITVANTSLLDYETATSHNVTVRATSTDGSTSDRTFTLSLTDDTSEFSVGAISDGNASADSVSESAANTTAVGVTAQASDGDCSDTVSYSLTDSAGGRFAIDSSSGVITVANTSLLDYETATSHNVTVRATSTDGSTSDRTFTLSLTDDTSEFSVGAISDGNASADSVSESAANTTAVGVTAQASDGDSSDTVSYSLTDSAGGRFAIDSSSGVITVANTSLLDYETATSHNVTVRATSTDGSTSDRTFTISILDAAEGTTGSDTLNGTAGDDTISGLAGSDTINGLGGNDSLYGGNDSDVLNGGAGNDLLDGGNDSGSDTLNGDAGNDTLIGGAGSDNLDGGADIDTADYSTAGGAVTADLAAGSANDGDGGSDNLTNIENLIGSAFGDTLTGDGAANSLNGGGGADTLVAAAGDDFIDWDSADLSVNGGTGDDTLRVTTGNADITSFAGTMLGIEAIDLSVDSGANTLTISAQDVLDISDTDTVTVIGDAGDSLSAGSGWSDGGVDGDGNQIYTQLVMGNTATLLVDPDVTVNADILP